MLDCLLSFLLWFVCAHSFCSFSHILCLRATSHESKYNSLFDLSFACIILRAIDIVSVQTHSQFSNRQQFWCWPISLWNFSVKFQCSAPRSNLNSNWTNIRFNEWYFALIDFSSILLVRIGCYQLVISNTIFLCVFAVWFMFLFKATFSLTAHHIIHNNTSEMWHWKHNFWLNWVNATRINFASRLYTCQTLLLYIILFKWGMNICYFCWCYNFVLWNGTNKKFDSFLLLVCWLVCVP